MNRTNLKILKDLYRKYNQERYPDMPEHFLPTRDYSDKTANGLTKCIIDFLTHSGWQAERINTMGKYDAYRKKWIKGTGTRGSADISATIFGKSVKIEIKIGKDRQSEDQKNYQQMIEKAGGVYIIAKDFDSFVEWYHQFELNNTI